MQPTDKAAQSAPAIDGTQTQQIPEVVELATVGDEEDFETPELIEFDHSPLTPPRPDLHGENVFAEQWKVLMASEPSEWADTMANHELCNILRWRDDEITQRAASVAATFIKWLGTSCGAAFLEDCARVSVLYPGSGHGYLMAWAVENQRQSWVNGGFRAIEHILALPSDRAPHAMHTLRTNPDLSVLDYDVVEAVVVWLSSTEGREFVEQCKKEITYRYTAEKVADAFGRRDFAMVKHLTKDLK